MAYILVDEQNNIILWPATFRSLRDQFPNVSFPKDAVSRWADYGLHEVQEVAAPLPSDPGAFRVVETDPKLVKGVWTQAYQEVPLTPAEIDARAEAAEVAADKAEVQADNLYQALQTMTTQQLDAWFDTNVGDLASARAAMKKMAKILLLAVKYGNVR